MINKSIAQRDQKVNSFKNISIYRNSYDTTGAQCNLDAIAERISTGEKELKEKTKKARTLATSDPLAYKEFKASQLPAPTFAGIFPHDKRQASHLAHHSGYIVLDIDNVPPLTFYALIAHLNTRTDIHLAFMSPSGTGIKLVVHVSPTPQNAAEHTAAYNSVLAYFDTLSTQFNFSFDESGKDCSRLCYLAHDPHLIYAPHAGPILWDRDAYLAKRSEKAKRTEKTTQIAYEGPIDIKALGYIDPSDYDTWYKVGIACKNAGVGFHVWDTWSSRDPKYGENSDGEMQRKWDSFTAQDLTWGTVVHFATANGYVPPQSERSDRRLQIDTTATESRKAALAAPSDVQNSLNADIVHAIDTPHTATPQFTILPHATGTGKSTTMLTRSHFAGKRVISLLFNHKLATQQTETAKNIGFSAYRFRGRGYNFEKTPLAKLPVKMREDNETLFDKYSVMCPLYDEVEKHTAKRISPLAVCFGCRLLDSCKKRGYWSQYADIQQADYLSVCRQDLPFNPDLWAFLFLLQSGKTPFEKLTDTSTEETAIAQMLGLGLETETETETKAFDFAVVDDYTASGLYTDVTYSIEELTTLIYAWRGTRTGEIIEKICDAIWELEKHKKDENTGTAIALLRGLFENMDTETRTASNENLTKHAARDPNGELSPVSPVTALKQGVPLAKLTPVWHSRTWTLLHQLEAMLTHCKNDAQAPIFCDGDTITFTVPPQIHPQLNKILFISAAANIEGTQNAFDRKDVSWTIAQDKQPRLAAGVQMFQYTDSRMTAGSIFENERDASGNVIFDHDNKPTRTGKLTPRTAELLQKIAALVHTSPHKSAFIGYKEFVDGQFTELPAIKKLHDAFDTVTHFDVAQGRNFDDYKIFVVFGYPKAEMHTIRKEARRQYAHDPQPLCFDYEYVTATEDGYTSEARRFLDPRVEKIRQQLTTDKLKQAIGRARHGRWENTLTWVITSEPVPSYTKLAAPITYKFIMTAESLEDLCKPQHATHKYIATNTDKAWPLHIEGHTSTKIANILNISKRHVQRILADHKSDSTMQSTIGDIKAKSRRVLVHGDCVEMSPHSTFQSQLIPTPVSHKKTPTNVTYVTLQSQILAILRNGEAKTRDIIASVDGHPSPIKTELRRLVNAGTIIKLRHGVYNVPTDPPPPRSFISEKTATEWERKIATGEIHRSIASLEDISETQKIYVTEVCIALLTEVLSRHRRGG